MSRRIVITGVSRGLGRAMVDEFAREGHTIFGCGTNEDRIVDLQNLYSDQHFDVVDVSDAARVDAWAQRVLAEGPPQLLINNAAIINRSERLWEVHPQEFETLMNVNVSGTFHTIRSFLPKMLEAGNGVVVNFSSGWGRSTSPEVVPYCASKFAIEGLSRGLSQEVGEEVAVVALNPGIIHTDMLDSCFGASASTFPEPKEWAKRAVPFLLGLNASDNGRSLDVP